MKLHMLKGGLPVLLVLCGLSSHAYSAMISIDPITQTATDGSQVVVNVDITGVTDLYGFQFDLEFNPSVLAAVSSSEGTFLPSGGGTFFVPGTIDNVGGTVSATADTLLTAITGVSGSGALATFDFTAIGPGSSSLSIANVTLLDSNLNSIPNTAGGGSVTVTNPTPLPAAAWLLLSGLGGLAAMRRCRVWMSRTR